MVDSDSAAMKVNPRVRGTIALGRRSRVKGSDGAGGRVCDDRAQRRRGERRDSERAGASEADSEGDCPS